MQLVASKRKSIVTTCDLIVTAVTHIVCDAKNSFSENSKVGEVTHTQQ